MRFFQNLKQWIGAVPLSQRSPRFEEMSDVEPPLREELFSNTQLESHARLLAATQILDFRPGSELLLHRLDENEEVIRRMLPILFGKVVRWRQARNGCWTITTLLRSR
jgi:hypothetical protein